MARGRVVLLVGTTKGAFLLHGDGRRRTWRVEGPYLAGWPVREVRWDTRTGTLLATGGHFSYGPFVARSADFGRGWNHESRGLTLTDMGTGDDQDGTPRDGRRARAVWTVLPGPADEPQVLYAGLQDAALFRSEDGGRRWHEVAGLRRHPTAARWLPGAGGLCLHGICSDPYAPDRMYVAVSAGGTYRTADGGQTWEPVNRGVRADFLPDPYPEVGQCVHHLTMHPERPQTLYQQNHCGVYRSDDRGDRWVDISEGLPSRFGFPILVHPREPETIYTVPVVSAERRLPPEGALAVWRSRDAGGTWTRLDRGLPARHAYGIVLRQALCTDGLAPAGLYFGTTSGTIFASTDEGASWDLACQHLPRVQSVRCAVLDGP